MTATRQRAKGGKYDSMNKDSPSGSLYEMLAEHDQSETSPRRNVTAMAYNVLYRYKSI
jgi:hypothetical protein